MDRSSIGGPDGSRGSIAAAAPRASIAAAAPRSSIATTAGGSFRGRSSIASCGPRSSIATPGREGGRCSVASRSSVAGLSGGSFRRGSTTPGTGHRSSIASRSSIVGRSSIAWPGKELLDAPPDYLAQARPPPRNSLRPAAAGSSSEQRLATPGRSSVFGDEAKPGLGSARSIFGGPGSTPQVKSAHALPRLSTLMKKGAAAAGKGGNTLFPAGGAIAALAAQSATRKRQERAHKLQYFGSLQDAAARVEDAMVRLQRPLGMRRASVISEDTGRMSLAPMETDAATELALSKIRVQKLLGTLHIDSSVSALTDVHGWLDGAADPGGVHERRYAPSRARPRPAAPPLWVQPPAPAPPRAHAPPPAAAAPLVAGTR